MRCLVLLVAWLLVSCSGKDGKDGAQGELGEPGEPGQPGERGEPGPAGVSCWDLDTDGECDTGSEDINADGSCDVFDCRADAAGSGTGGSTGTGGAGPTGTDTGGSGATTTGGSAGSPGVATCAPSDMSSWTPPAYKPARAAEAVCTEAVLTEFFSSECEWGGCPEFQPGGQHEVCGACLTGSSVDDAEWGPFVIVRLPSGGAASAINVGGCLELSGQAGCGAQYQTGLLCRHQACVDDCFEAPEYNQCKSEADAVCADYPATPSCIAPPAPSCGSFIDAAAVFCGS